MTSIQLSEIIRALSSAKEECVLATLIKVSGSSFRRPGARMLVLSDGSTAGGISAGCLEDEIRARCFEWTREGTCTRQFQIGTPEDDVFGWASGCKGTLEVLLQRVTPDDSIIRRINRGFTTRKWSLLATVVDASPGTSLSLGDRILHANDALHADIDLHELHEILTVEARREMGRGKVRTVEYSRPNDSFSLLWEPLQPPIQLCVFGTGDGAKHLLDCAQNLEWKTALCDKRTELFQRQNGLSADNIYELMPGELPEEMSCDTRTAAVVMTHHFADDVAIVDALLRTQIPYIGVLGGRMRNDRLRAELASSFSPEQLSRLFAPIGLDIGAEDAVEIATSIAGEVLAFMNHRSAGHLSARPESIHTITPNERRTLPSLLVRGAAVFQSCS